MPEIEIYGYPQSTYVRTARMVCLEKGEPHRVTPVELGSESYRQHHPFAKMPALEHGKVRLYETLAIASYVDSLSKTPALVPSDGTERAEMLMVVSALNAYGYSALVVGTLEALHEGKPLDEAGLERVARVLGSRLEGRSFLVGANLTLADLFLAPMLAFAKTAAPARGIIESVPAIERWFGRIAERESFRSTQA